MDYLRAVQGSQLQEYQDENKRLIERMSAREEMYKDVERFRWLADNGHRVFGTATGGVTLFMFLSTREEMDLRMLIDGLRRR